METEFIFFVIQRSIPDKDAENVGVLTSHSHRRKLFLSELVAIAVMSCVKHGGLQHISVVSFNK